MYTVYVVDDDELVLDEIMTTINWLDNGFEVIGFASSPKKAIAEIIQLKPRLVLTDLKMLEIDGISLIKQIKENNINCEFIMLSAYPNFDESREFFRLDGFDYLLKPIKQDEVQIVLERLSKRLSLENSNPKPSGQNIVPNFLQMTEHIQKNYNKKHSLEDLGKQFGLSPNYICNLFSKHYNTTFTRFITEIRMTKAEEFIKNGERTFKVVASKCGYSDYYYFCRVFKEYFGESPTNYLKDRERQNKEENIE